jgi:hypothetical protein
MEREFVFAAADVADGSMGQSRRTFERAIVWEGFLRHKRSSCFAEGRGAMNDSFLLLRLRLSGLFLPHCN